MMKQSIATLGVIAVMGAVPVALAQSATPNTPATSGSGTSATMQNRGGTMDSRAPATANAPAAPAMNRTEAGKLIGQSVETTSGERIGEVEAVHIGRDGQVTDVIVGVGGFLGVGERDVALSWRDLQVSNNGSKVVTNLTKSRLETLTPYRYSSPSQRGTVFDAPG